MGAADLVPGVSGGTVIFSLGLYRKLLDSINTFGKISSSLIRLDIPSAKIFFSDFDWVLVITLSLSALTGVFLFGNIIKTQLELNPILIAALFNGFVCAAVIFTYRSVGYQNKIQLILMVSTAILVFISLGIFDNQKITADEDIEIWFFFIAGIIAISAMLLPGISGSLMLIIMGLYESVLSALIDFQISIILTFLLGVIVGIIGFAKVINWTLNKYYFYVMSVLIGFTAGSLRILWPWPNGLDNALLALPENDVLFPILFWLIGFMVIAVMSYISHLVYQNR